MEVDPLIFFFGIVFNGLGLQFLIGDIEVSTDFGPMQTDKLN